MRRPLSSVVLAATGERDDYWHRATRALVDPGPGRGLAEAAFAAMAALPPETPAERALAIAALGRWALATDDADRRHRTLRLARGHAGALAFPPSDASPEDLALAVYGLIEAGRLLEEDLWRASSSSSRA